MREGYPPSAFGVVTAIFRRRHGHPSFVRHRLVGVVIHPEMHLHLGAESVVVALFEKAKAVEVLVAAADQPCEAV